MVDEKERVATAQWILERNLNWIAWADIKVGVLATLDVAMFGGLGAAYALPNHGHMGVVTWAAMILACAGLVTSLCFACAVLIPNMKAASLNREQAASHMSLVFFKEIASRHADAYGEALATKSDGELLADWARQIHRNAQIAEIKHSRLRWAVYATCTALTPWITAVILLVVTTGGSETP
jgi:hypothetical protein